MIDKIKVSFIIPCYNVEKYIFKCIESIINQSEKNIEVICIDDGSTDNTYEILNKYAKEDNRLKIIKKENGGVASARNMGIINASGEFIMFVDGDDYVDKKIAKEMYMVAKREEADIVKCNRYDVYLKPYKIIKRKALYNEETVIPKERYSEIYIDFLKRAKLGSCWMSLIRRDIIIDNNIMFNENLKCDEDVVFLFQAFTESKKFVYIPDAYYYYVRHGQGLSAKGINLEERYKSRKEHTKILKRYIELWNIENSEILLREKITYVYIYTAFQVSRANKKIKFFERYILFKKIVKDEELNKNIKNAEGKILNMPEKIMYGLVKWRCYFLAYLYGIICNFFIDLLRPMLEKYRN